MAVSAVHLPFHTRGSVMWSPRAPAEAAVRLCVLERMFISLPSLQVPSVCSEVGNPPWGW